MCSHVLLKLLIRLIDLNIQVHVDAYYEDDSTSNNAKRISSTIDFSTGMYAPNGPTNASDDVKNTTKATMLEMIHVNIIMI